MNETTNCPKCGAIEKTTKQFRGSGGLAIFLWIIPIACLFVRFIEPIQLYEDSEKVLLRLYFWMAIALPALGYSIWRLRSGYLVCDKCKTPLDPNWQPTNKMAVAGLIFGLTPQIPYAVCTPLALFPISGIITLIIGNRIMKKAKASGGQGKSVGKRVVLLGVLNVVGYWIFIAIAIKFKFPGFV
jgi:hypothetical protein